MIGTTRSRVSFFMNRFRKLGFIEYNGRIQVHKSLLNVILLDQLPEHNSQKPPVVSGPKGFPMGSRGELQLLGKPVESALLRAMGKTVDIQWCFKLQSFRMSEECIDLPGCLNLALHIRKPRIAVEHGCNYQCRLRRNRCQYFIEIEGDTIFVADKEAQAGQQAVQTGILPDTFGALVCGIDAQRIYPAD